MTTAGRWMPSAHAIRLCIAGILVLSGLLLSTIFVHQLVLPLLAAFIPDLETTIYDLAVYGTAPTRKYISFNSQSPEVSVLQWHDKCDDGGNIFIGPYGKWVETPGPTILDSRGNLIWTTQDYDLVTNFRMQEYNDEHFLTFWSGHKEGAKGKGDMFMLNSRYEVAHKLHAVGEGLYGDVHEFQLTNDGTALITVYNDTTIDMREFSAFRSEHGWVTDCLFQEIDIETNELLFQWVASEHVRAADTHYFQPFGGWSASNPFDYFHINSVEKDSKGNYLISSRHFHTITYIDGKDGDIIWTLGADSSDFEDISVTPGAATDFCWSHHARWLDEEAGTISLFDNGNAGPLHQDRDTSKGMVLQVDSENRTVKLLTEFKARYKVRSNSQGDFQYLPDKDEVFIGWGSAAMWTQHEMDGTQLCEVHYSPSLLYFLEKVRSYRVFKAWGWKGDPQWPPSARVVGGKLHGSWNGATEVRSLRVEGRRDEEDDVGKFETIGTHEKVGFETVFELPPKGFSRFRLVALDADDVILGLSEPLEPEEPGSPVPVIMGAIFGILFMAGFLYLLWFLLARRPEVSLMFPWRRRILWSDYQYSKL